MAVSESTHPSGQTQSMETPRIPLGQKTARILAAAALAASLSPETAKADHVEENQELEPNPTSFVTSFCDSHEPNALAGHIITLTNHSDSYTMSYYVEGPLGERFTDEYGGIVPGSSVQLTFTSNQQSLPEGIYDLGFTWHGHNDGNDHTETAALTTPAIDCPPPPNENRFVQGEQYYSPRTGDNGTGGPEHPIENVDTISGADRIETAVETSRRFFDQAQTVVLATGDNYPDALAGGPLARLLEGPLLLTLSSRLDARVAEELQRLGTQEVILLGGENALSQEVKNALEDMGINTQRIFGRNRFETATAIAAELYSTTETSTARSDDSTEEVPNEVFLTSGQNFPDAIAVSALAAREGAPIMLTATNNLPSIVSEFLHERRELIQRVTVVGGAAAVSATVEQQAASAATASSTRLSGAHRFATSAAVATEDLRRQGSNLNAAFLATGLNFPDALTAGPAVATEDGASLVLVHGQSTSEDAHTAFDDWAKAHKTENWNSMIRFGGNAAIASAVWNYLVTTVGSHPVNPR